MNIKKLFKFSTKTKLKQIITSGIKSFKSKQQHLTDDLSLPKKKVVNKNNSPGNIKPGVFPLGGLIG